MRPQVVLVDDDPESCQALGELLTQEGFEIHGFQSSEAVCVALESGALRPDVVVADVRMPGLDGVALLRQIKAQFPRIPVVLVSAFADEQVWLAGLEAGAADVFPKPIHGASLVRVLRRAVGATQESGQPVGDNPDPRDSGITEERSVT